MTCSLRLALSMSVAFASAPVLAGAAQDRLASFRAEAARERARLGFAEADPGLAKSYPAPQLEPLAEVARACPGQTVQVALAGRFVRGSLVVVLSEDVEIVAETFSVTAWRATVRVRPDVPPQDVLVKVMTPVSEASAVTRLLDIGCEHQWVLELSNGERLTVNTSWPRGADTGVPAQGRWSKGSNELGVVSLLVHGGATFSFERVPSAAEQAAVEKANMAPAVLAADKRMAAAQQRLNACSKGAAAQQESCLKTGGEELAKVAGERDAAWRKSLGDAFPRFGCDRLRVHRTASGLTGDAEGCVSGRRDKVSGTVTSAGTPR